MFLGIVKRAFLGHALASVPLFCVSCGPKRSDMSYEVAGSYTVRTSWRDGQFDGEPASIVLSADGTATRFGPDCPGPLVVTSDLHWDQNGSTVSIFADDTNELFARMELDSEQCGEHQYFSGGSDRSTAYVSGRYCPVDIEDNGHLGQVCGGWVPCDEVADGCVDSFNREYDE